jgi:hypothetical protein
MNSEERLLKGLRELYRLLSRIYDEIHANGDMIMRGMAEMSKALLEYQREHPAAAERNESLTEAAVLEKESEEEELF